MNTHLENVHSFINQNTTSEIDAPWFLNLRQGGQRSFLKSGLPTVRDEAWKYTSLKRLNDVNWKVVTNNNAEDKIPWLNIGTRLKLVFVNGCFNKSLSIIENLPEGSFIGSLPDALDLHGEKLRGHLGQLAEPDSNPLVALNTANMSDGFVIFLDDIILEDAIEVIHLGNAYERKIAYHPRNLVILENTSKAQILEQFIGSKSEMYFSNSMLEISISGNSHLQHDRIFIDESKGIGVHNVVVNVGSLSRYSSFTFIDGGEMVRNDLKVRLTDIGSEAKLGGIYIAGGTQHIDNTTIINHEMPDTLSKQIFKGALKDASCGVFQGNVVVQTGADGADGKLNNKTLLLSPKSIANSKPQLEVYADDVQCSHGSAIGELDEQALFYLRSRGIPFEEARALLVEGFLSEVFGEFQLGPIEEVCRLRILGWMNRI